MMLGHHEVSHEPTIEKDGEFVTVYSVADDAIAECVKLLNAIGLFPRYASGEFIRDYQLNGKWLRGYYK